MSNNDNVADLCERLRRKAGFNDPVTGEYVNFPTQPDGSEAADTLERQAAEIERLREALERLASSEAFDLPRIIDGPLAQELRMRLDYARAALTGED